MKRSRWLALGIGLALLGCWASIALAGFVDNGNGTVSDTVTGLMWQKEDSQNDAGGRTWEEALNYCESLTLPSGGYSDWRLPNVRELETLVDWDRYYPAIDPLFSCRSSSYWSGSTSAYNPAYAWLVYFHNGYVYDFYKANHNYVRCVRGGPSGSFGNLDHFVISNTSGGDIPDQAVNAWFSVLIKAVDAGGNTVTSFNGEVSLSTPGGIYPISARLGSGQGTVSVKLYTGGTTRINCSGYGAYGNSNYFSVSGGSACSGKISGKVKTANGNPLTQVSVKLYNSSGQTVGPVFTDAEGNYAFSGLGCDTYELRAEKGEYAASYSDIRITGVMACKLNDIVLSGGTGTTPVILVMGMMGSTTCVDCIYPRLSQTMPCKDLFPWDFPNPLDGYRGIAGWNELFVKLVEEGLWTYFCPWDWRMDCRLAYKEFLKPKIDEALKHSTSGKVDIVAHSTGGLVVRAYLQSDEYKARNDVRKVAFLGTPHLGSVNPYYIWEGGNPKGLDDITDSGWIQFKNPYSNVVEYLWKEYYNMRFWSNLRHNSIRSFVRNVAPSLRQLMYTGEFLRYLPTGDVWEVDTDGNENDWLKNLNNGEGGYSKPEDVMSPEVSESKVQAILFVGNKKNSTIRYINTEGDIYVNDKYEDGIPALPLHFSAVKDDGDGTVPYDSATWPEKDEWGELYSKRFGGDHVSLIRDFQGEIIAFLKGTLGSFEAVTNWNNDKSFQTDGSSATLSISGMGDARLLVEDPAGLKTGIDPSTQDPVEQIGQATCAFKSDGGGVTVKGPCVGTYQVAYFGEEGRNLFLTIEYADGSTTETYSYQGIARALAQNFRIAVNPSASPRLTITPPAKAPANLQANPYTSGTEKTRLTWAATGEAGLTGYNIYAVAELEPYFTKVTTVGVGTTTYDTADAWSSSSATTVKTYAVAAVKTGGIESFFSNLVQNNDRDHDGLTDAEEPGLGTDPTKADTDGDGLKDGDEQAYNTNPLVKDTDGDTYNDYAEIQAGTDPLDPQSMPSLPSEERQALEALYDSTNGSGWTDNTGWKTETDPCSWYGVTCSEGHVTGLSLGNNKLTGAIPAEIGSLTNLTSLVLGWNPQLTGPIPPEIGNLAKLASLSLWGNEHNGPIPPEIGQLVNLNYLDLGGDSWVGTNNLSGSIPAEIGNLTNLTSLGLDDNQLTGVIPSVIGNLTNLTRLDLRGNDLTGSIPSAIGNLTNLKDLSLGSNQLTGNIPSVIGNLTKVTRLDLGGNDLTGSIPSAIGNLTNLKDLSLGSNQLTGNIPPEIGNLTDLDYLAFYANDFTGAIPSEIGNITNLRYLNLGSNQLTGNIPSVIWSLTNLEFLELYNNHLTGAIPPDVGNLVNLKDLELHDNQFTALPTNLPETIEYLYVQENNLTFESLEPYIHSPFDYFTYSPQAVVPVSPKTVALNQGQNLSLSVTVGGGHNQYQWFKDGVAVSSVSTNPAYSKSNVTASDAGTYVCHITNTVVTGLTLYTEDITVTVVAPPTVSTAAVTPVTPTSATSGGNVTSEGGSPVTARGVCWSTSPNPTRANSKTTNGSGTGSFTSSLTGLTPGTPYYVRAYATNSQGTAYGNEVSFTTMAGTPTLTTAAVSSITQTTATSGGNVSSDGGAAVTARGVCWSNSPNPTTANSKTINGSGTGSFTSNITGLSPGTPYYVRAYATNSQGTTYGNGIPFTTSAGLPTLTTASVSVIDSTSATSGGNVTSDGGADVTSRGVCWSTSDHPTTDDPHTSDGTGEGSFTSQLTDLTPGTIYYVCAYAINSQGTSYGGDLSFMTHYSGMRYVHPSGGCGAYQPCYGSIQAAIDAAADGDMILACHGDYHEAIVLDQAKSLTLLCGRNDDFSPSTLFSTAHDLQINKGTLIVEGLHLSDD